jgi:hypothetical protein
MIKSVIAKGKNTLIILPIVALSVLNYSFNKISGDIEWLEWSNKCLNESFDPSAVSKLKKWEIMLTPDHFIRFRKTYQHGKQEYFSFNLSRLDNIDYLGTPENGSLQFKTLKDDIIVQTYDDPKGNIDSMATVLEIPVKDMTPEKLDSLNDAVKYLKDKTP